MTTCVYCGKRQPKPKDKLNPRQEAFVAYYIENKGNGTDAARKAGYKGNDNVLAATASRMLRNAKVKANLELMAIPLNHLVHKTIRQVMGDDNPHAQSRAAELAAKILGIIAPTRHHHLHAHVLPAVEPGDEPEELRRMVRVVLRGMGEGERRAFLAPLLDEDAAELLPVEARVVDEIEAAPE